MKIELKNPNDSSVVSTLLNDIARTHPSAMIQRNTKALDLEKGEIVTGIIVGITSAALYDLVKSLIKRLSRGPAYDGSLRLIIDGKEYTLSELTQKELQ